MRQVRAPIQMNELLYWVDKAETFRFGLTVTNAMLIHTHETVVYMRKFPKEIPIFWPIELPHTYMPPDTQLYTLYTVAYTLTL